MKRAKIEGATVPAYSVSTLWESDFGSVVLADGKGAFPFILARVEVTMDGGWEWSAGSESGTNYVSQKDAMQCAEQSLIRTCEKWVKLLTPQVSSDACNCAEAHRSDGRHVPGCPGKAHP
jgi:hypothetical protein